MFRIETFCDDLKLPRVLHALTGLVIGQPSIQPAANAMTKDGKVVARVTNGDRIEILRQRLKKDRVASVDPAYIRAFAVTHGLSETSYSAVLKQAIEYGLLKKDPKSKGKHTRYLVVATKGGK